LIQEKLILEKIDNAGGDSNANCKTIKEIYPTPSVLTLHNPQIHLGEKEKKESLKTP